jgi:hypothetical protein
MVVDCEKKGRAIRIPNARNRRSKPCEDGNNNRSTLSSPVP